MVKQHICRWCHLKWEHELGQFCPHCCRFQTPPENLTYDQIMEARKHIGPPIENLIAEVYILVHYHGQMRFRLYINEGQFKYDVSDVSFDRKIEGMTGRNVSRITTTHEYADFEYMKDGVNRKSVIITAFEELIATIKTPLQYLGNMIRMEEHIDKDIVEIYVFPIGPLKRKIIEG